MACVRLLESSSCGGNNLRADIRWGCVCSRELLYSPLIRGFCCPKPFFFWSHHPIFFTRKGFLMLHSHWTQYFFFFFAISFALVTFGVNAQRPGASGRTSTSTLVVRQSWLKPQKTHIVPSWQIAVTTQSWPHLLIYLLEHVSFDRLLSAATLSRAQQSCSLAILRGIIIKVTLLDLVVCAGRPRWTFCCSTPLDFN